MASLAGMLQLRGHRITGSDKAAYPPMSDVLRELGIPVMEPYAEANLDPRPDLVVMGNALSRGNRGSGACAGQADSVYVDGGGAARGVSARGASRWWWRGRMARRRRRACWRGFIRWRRGRQPELAPSFLIGGVAENFGRAFKCGRTRPFILEGDEYDTAFFDKGPKFLHYFPDALILTHVEFDHADIYADLEAVKTAFKRLVNLVPRRGRDRGVRRQRECERVRGAGVLPRGAVRISGRTRTGGSRNLAHEGGRDALEGAARRRAFAELRLPMAGEHNALNATAAAALAAGQGVPEEAIVEALATFQEREAAAGGAGRGGWRDDHRRLCASSDGDSRDAAGAADGVSAGGGCGRCWSRGRIRCGAMCCKATWWRACALADRVVLAGVFKQQADSGGRAAASGGCGARAERAGHAGRAVPGCGGDCGRDCSAVAAPETWWRFFPTAGLTESMRSFRRASRPANQAQ